MIPPKGFRNALHPLRHKMYYAGGLSVVTGTMNSTILCLVRNYKTINDGTSIIVNPKHASFEVETGAVCGKMSIIDKLRMTLKFSYTKVGQTDSVPIHGMWMPIFFSFPEKLDAADDKTTTTVATILSLLKDATQEDVTPLFNNTKLDVTGTSDRSQPLSTANMTETVAIMNMDTDATMEAVSWDNATFYKALQYYTNKGALKACIGRTRHFTLDDSRRHKNYFINKFVPRAVRRIQPYSFFGILVHCPTTAENDQYYFGTGPTPSVAHIGFTCNIDYHEWSSDHHQEMT